MEYLVVLVAALFHAIWNSMIKNSGEKLLTLGYIRFVGLVYGLIVITTQPMIDLNAVPYLLIATTIHFAYFYCLLNAYKFGDFSQVYPISRGLAPLVVLSLGAFIAGEYLNNWQLLGTLLICLGVLSLAFGGDKKHQAKPLLFAIGTGLCIAGYTFASGLGVRVAGNFLVYSGWLEVLTGAFTLIFIVAKKPGDIIPYSKSNYKGALSAGILSISAYVAALWAMSRVPMAPVAAVRETSIIFAAVIGAVAMKEGCAAKRIVASFLVAVGVVLLGVFSG
ncbi:MAG: EamA family transporter [Psychrosphaera sp.]|nr:EamA family transporter [Psychrosphaera sp.]